MDVLYDLKPYMNCKIQLNTKDGTFNGILSFIDLVTTKIGLYDVEELPSNEKLIGLQVFYPPEIIEYSIIDKKKKEATKSIKKPNPRVWRNHNQKNNYAVLLDSELSDQEKEENISIRDIEDEEEYILQLPEVYEKILPREHVFIDVCDETFHNAIKHICQEQIIGIAFEGDNISRTGEICIITISTGECTFLFDICALKEKAFNNGLKDIFENSSIEKVIHDCRYPADALFHVYNTELVHVFDTVASHLYIREIHQRNRKVKPYEWSLIWSLEQHLKLSREDLSGKYFSAVKAITNWTCRPLRNALRERAIHNVIFLRVLREICITKMLAEFYKLVDVFNGVVRNRTEDELQLQETDCDYLPMKYAGVSVKIAQVSQYFRGDRRNPFGDFLKSICEHGFETPIIQNHHFPFDAPEEAFVKSPSYTPLSPKVDDSHGASRWGTLHNPDESPSSRNITRCIPSYKDDCITSWLHNESQPHKPSFNNFIAPISKNNSSCPVTIKNESLSSSDMSHNKPEEESVWPNTAMKKHVPYIAAGHEVYSISDHKRAILQNILEKYNSPQSSEDQSYIPRDQCTKSEASISLSDKSLSNYTNGDLNILSPEQKEYVSVDFNKCVFSSERKKKKKIFDY